MRASFYIDGLNMYYGCFKRKKQALDHSDKWVDLEAMCTDIPDANEQVHRIKYFTATVIDTGKGGQAIRHEMYLRTLRTLRNPGVQIQQGQFRPCAKHGQLVQYGPGGPSGAWSAGRRRGLRGERDGR